MAATLSEPPPIINIQQQVPSFSSTSHSDSVMWVAAAAAAASASATTLPQPTAGLQQVVDDGSSMGPGAVESAAYNLFSGGHTFWNNQQSADRFGSLVPPGDSAPAKTTPTAHSVLPMSRPNPTTRLAHFMSLHVDDSSSSWMHQLDLDSENHQHHPQHGVVPTHQLQWQQANSSDAFVYRNFHKLLYPASQAPSSVGTGAAPLSSAAYPAPHYHSNHQPRRHSFGVMTSDGSPVGGVPGHSRRTPPSRSAQSMEEVESILGGRRACDSSATSSMKWKPKKPPKYKGRFYPVIGGREGSCLYKKKKHAIKQTKGLPNSAMKAFNLYEKAKGWLDEQLDVDIEWMTKKELARYTRVSTGNAAVSGGDSGGESDSDDEGPDASVSQDKIEKVFTVVQSRTGKPVIVCTRYALLGAESSDGAESTIVLGSFMSYRSADAFVRPNAYGASAHAPKHANSIRGSMMIRERGGYQQTSFRQAQHYPLQEQPVHQHWGRQQQHHHQRHYSSQAGYTGEPEKVSDGWLQQQSWGTSMGDNKHLISSPSMPPPPAPPPSRPSARSYYARQAEQPQRGGLYGAPGGHRSLTPLAPASAVNSGTNGIMQSGRWDQARSSSSDDDVTDGQLYSRSTHLEAAPQCFHSHQYGQYSTDGDGHCEGAMSESHPDYIAGMLKDLWDTGASDAGSSMADTWNVNYFHY